MPEPVWLQEVVFLALLGACAWLMYVVSERAWGHFGEIELSEKPVTLTSADRVLMKDLGITHNGSYFELGEMHYDHLGEAVEAARYIRSRKA